MKSFRKKTGLVLGCASLLVAGLLVLFALFSPRQPEKTIAPVPKPKPAAPVSVPAAPEKIDAQKIRLKILGRSTQNRPIESYIFGDGETLLVFAGGIHGGYEWNSVLLAYQLVDYLRMNPKAMPPNLTVAVMPVINPDGLYKITGKSGRFSIADVPDGSNSSGRLNANGVDLNRNFGCNWKADAVWQGNNVGAGAAPFSEPESVAIKNFVLENKPAAVIIWHSKSGTVYGSGCGKDMLGETADILNAYAKTAGYAAAPTFDQYAISGDASDWLASIGIPAITVELATHESIEWEKNLAGVQAIFKYFEKSGFKNQSLYFKRLVLESAINKR